MKQFTLSVAKKAGYTLAVCVILLAILVVATRLLMPILDEHRVDIERWSSEMLQTPVTIDRVRLSWFQYQPVISLNRVTVLDKQSKQPVLQVKRVHILLSIPQSIQQRSFVLSGIVISGTEVTLHQSSKGNIAVEGFPALGGYSTQPYTSESKFSDVLKWVAAEPRLILRDIDIRYTNNNNRQRYITLYDLRLNNESAEHTISGKAILHQDLPTEVNISVKWWGDPVDLSHIKANAYLYVSGFSVAQWLQGYSWHGWNVSDGAAVAKLWLAWNNNAITKVQSELTAYDLILHAEADKSIHKIQRLSGNFGWKLEEGNQVYAGNDILIDLPDHLWPVTSFYVALTPTPDGKLTPKAINLGYVDLHDIQYPIFSLQLVSEEWKKTIQTLQLQGNLENASIIFNGATDDINKTSISADFYRVSFAPVAHHPGVKNISGEVSWTGKEGKLSLQSLQTKFQLDSVFLQPISLEQLSGNINWQKNAKNDWEVKITGLQLKNDDLTMSAKGDLTISPAQKINTDIKAEFSLKQAKNVTRYLPMRIFSADLVKWLQQAFLSGTVATGTAVLRGPLEDYPFDKGNGEFRIGGKVEHIDLRYAPEWPVLSDLTGELMFAGRQMIVDVSHGATTGIPLAKVHAVIPYLGDDKPQVLEVQSAPIDTDMNAGIAFLHASPLEATIGKMFANSKLHGPIQLKLNLTVPLNHPDNTKVQGDIAIKDVEMNLVPWGLVIEHLHGQLLFTESDTNATGIQGQLFTHPLVLSLQTLKKPKGQSIVRASITNEWTIPDLEAWLKVPLAKYAQGKAELTGTIDFTDQAPITAHLSSNLVGVTVTVPEPQYAKAANLPRKFTADIVVQDKQPIKLKMYYGNLLGTALVLERKADKFNLKAAVISLGKGVVNWPAQSGLYLTGDIPQVDWDKIKSYSDQVNTNNVSDLALREIDVLIGKLNLPGQSLSETRIQLTPVAAGWQMVISNADMAGQVSFPRKLTPQGVINAQFQQLRLNTATNTTKSNFDVKAIPNINFTANNVSYNSMPLGQVSFKTAPSNNGMVIRSLAIDSGRMNLRASGDWQQAGALSTTRLQGAANSGNVSGFLSSLGFDVHNFISGKGRVDFKLSWQGAPYAPSLTNLNGNASIDLDKGRIVEVSQTSGAKMDLGRMLSIFSLQTIPRRLSLDFSDVFQKGYSFDLFRGDFNFAKGSAYTTNTHFEGPVAQVSINGRIGLAAKDYDFTLSVTPHVTSSIPVAATLLTGQPLIGIAALAVSGVIGSQVSKATTYYYAVRGPWSNPAWDSIKSPR